MAAFEKGDKVAIGGFATAHAAGSIIRADAVPEGTALGTVVGAANDEETWFTVKTDDGDRVLTEDELVKVAD